MTSQNLTDINARAQRAYLENRVQGADPEELLLILYQGLLQSIRAGQYALEDEVWDEAHAELSKSRRIVTYLTNSLRTEGGEISDRLRQLYGFCFENIARASLEKKPALLDGVVNVVKELIGAWSDLIRVQDLTARGGESVEEK